MLLSKLAYLVVKNAIYYSNSEFNYESFTRGDFDNDSDYALNINNAFSPINEAIARLSDLDKIPHCIVKTETKENGFQVSLQQLYQTIEGKAVGVKEVVSVADNNYRKIAHKPFGIDSLLLERPCNEVYVEFKADLPVFSKLDLGEIDLVSNTYTDSNIELNRFGLNDSVCNYIIEYAQGRLMEPIAPELANMHLTRAETYFANIRSVKTAFPQSKVENAYGSEQTIWFDSDGFRIN